MKKFLGLVLSLCLFSLQASALELGKQVKFEIPAQSLSTALIRFAQQTDIQVVTAGQKLEGVETKGVAGVLTIEEALQRLLSGTGFSFRTVGDGTISIIPTRSGGDRTASGTDPV